MTYRETIEFLNKIRLLDRRIRRMEIWHDEMESCLLPGGIRYDKDPVQTSPEDKMSEIAGRVVDLERDIRNLQLEKSRVTYEVGMAIEQLDDEDEKTVLSAFYIGRMPMVDVAEIIHYSLSRSYDIRRNAIGHLAELSES